MNKLNAICRVTLVSTMTIWSLSAVANDCPDTFSSKESHAEQSSKNFLKLFRRSGNLRNTARQLKRRIIAVESDNQHIAISNLNKNEVQSLRYIGLELDKINMAGLNNKILANMNKSTVLALSEKKLKEIDLRKASDILEIFKNNHFDRFTIVVKSNIAREIPLPKLPVSTVNHTLNRFTPDEIPKLNGIGKYPDILINLSPEQARRLTLRQAKDMKDYLDHNPGLHLRSEWKEQIKAINDILAAERNL